MWVYIFYLAHLIFPQTSRDGWSLNWPPEEGYGRRQTDCHVATQGASSWFSQITLPWKAIRITPSHTLLLAAQPFSATPLQLLTMRKITPEEIKPLVHHPHCLALYSPTKRFPAGYHPLSFSWAPVLFVKSRRISPQRIPCPPIPHPPGPASLSSGHPSLLNRDSLSGEKPTLSWLWIPNTSGSPANAQ